MKNFSETIKKINKKYIGNDCVQVIIPYEDGLTILSEDGILYHYKTGSKLYINKYIWDKRRKQFPYSKIHAHFTKKGLNRKKVYVNQLFEYNKPYIEVGDGKFLLKYVIRDNNDAYLITSKKKINYQEIDMTYDELINYCSKKEDDKDIFYIYLTGALPYSRDNIFPLETEIYDFIKEKFLQNIEELKTDVKIHDPIGEFFRKNPWILSYTENNINNIDYSLIDYNIGIGDPLLIVRIKEDNIYIQYMDIVFVKKNDYKVYIYDIPVNKYTLEMIKNIPLVKPDKKPRFSHRLNYGFRLKEIKQVKNILK